MLGTKSATTPANAPLVILASCLLALALPPAARAAQHGLAGHGSVPTVYAAPAATPILVDGRLNDGPWVFAFPATEFRQSDPEEGRPATERTELRVVYDRDALYVGVRLFDSDPARIVRRGSRRDEDVDADSITLYLDAHHDHLTGALFEVTAAGVQTDAIIYDDSWDDPSWDGVWASAVSLDEEGWTVEMRIPFSQLRFTKAERHTWGLNAVRYIQRKNEIAWLELVPKSESGLASRMAHLTGLDGLQPSRHVELLPYTVARAEFIAPLDRDPFNDGSRVFGNAGLDVKYGITNNLTVDATINPDFGQVEVDPAIVNLTDFETFFEEKRPFFVEGAQTFANFGRGGGNSDWAFTSFNSVEPQLVYSRRIGRAPQGEFFDAEHADLPPTTTILGAMKLTGKTAGGWNMGLLNAVTDREVARLATGTERARLEIEPRTNYFVGRLQREVRRRAGFGVLGTAVHRDLRRVELKNLLVKEAYVAGADGYVFLDGRRDWVITGQMAGSWLGGSRAALERVQRSPQRYYQRPDARHVRLNAAATSLAGWSGRATLNRNNGTWIVNASMWGVSPGFESNDLGFQSGGDLAGSHGMLLWRKPYPDRLTRSRSLSVAKWWTWNFNRERQGDGWHLAADATLLNYWSVSGTFSSGRRVLDDRLTRGGPSVVRPSTLGGSAGLGSDSRKPVSFAVDGSYSENEYGGWEGGGSVFVTVKPLAPVTISIGPNLTRSHTLAQYVRAVSDPTAVHTFGIRYVFAELEQTELSMVTRVTVAPSSKVSLQVYAQPLLSAGDYRGFKELARPRTFDFLRYGRQTGSLSYSATDLEYLVDPDGLGPALPFTFEDPAFNFKSLRINAVFRWEWRPGSTLYVAWTQRREDFTRAGEVAVGRDAGALFHAPADDVLAVKLAYWFGR